MSSISYSATTASRLKTTPDQAQAINAVLSDMCHRWRWTGWWETSASAKPKWRDARRVPGVKTINRWRYWCRLRCWRSNTGDNFRDRFANWPVRIEMLSRFRSAPKSRRKLRRKPPRVRRYSGSVRINCLQSDVKAARPGLLTSISC